MTERLPDDVARAIAAEAPRLGAFAALTYVAEVGSTNDHALRLAAAGAPEGASVLADLQRDGRGRRGRTWFSPAGSGIYLSVVLRPSGPPAALPLVTLAAGVAAARGIAHATGVRAELKWPNDLVVGRPFRKLGGILCEAAGNADVTAVIAGIGINLQPAAYPPELRDRATSIESELGRSVDRGAAVAAILGELGEWTHLLWRGETTRVCEEWRRLARGTLGGEPVSWKDGAEGRRGIARDIADDGALLVDAGGRIERIVSGEVTWERHSRD
jgi:BirA family biotin operon repressor/biotin-[acetyl-CoA-carboxylase] ligase